MNLSRRAQSVSLRYKILIPVSLILTVAFLCIYLAAAKILEFQRQDFGKRQGMRIASTIRGGITDALSEGRMEDVERTLQSVRSGSSWRPSRVSLLDAKGNEVFKNPQGKSETRLIEDLPGPGEIRTVERNVSTGRFVSVTASLQNAPKCYRCHGSGNQTLGYLEVGISAAWLKQRNDRSLTLIAVIAGATLLLVCVAIVVSTNAAIVRPLGHLSDAIAVVEKGHRRVNLGHPADDEIGRLNTSFQDMVREVAEAERELMETAAQLAKAEKLAGIGLMTAGVAHEINNPLAAVAMAAESLSLQGINEDQRNKMTASILEGTKRIQAIVSELLTLDQKRAINPEPVAVRAVVDDALASLSIPSVIDIKCRISDNLPKIRVDRDSISRALGNILKNAVQAMPDGGELSVSAESVGDGMMISIEDTGLGIAPEKLDSIFDPFYSSREVGAGFGLGLAFADAAVRQHGGDILVKSEPGRGTAFMVALPLDGVNVENRGEWLSASPPPDDGNEDA